MSKKIIILPPNKPRLSFADAQNYKPQNVDSSKLWLLGLRGYFKDSMGRRGTNDIGIYDDAIFIITPSVFSSYNANTDPSRALKDVAVLKPGTYLYKLGLHNMSNPYLALRQYSRVTVYRSGKEYTDTPQAPFYIDIHKGGFGTTSSLGCQTIYPLQWNGFLSTVQDQLTRYGQTVIPYTLAEIV